MVPSLCLRCSLLHMNILLLSGLYATPISLSLSFPPSFLLFIPLLSLSLSLSLCLREHISRLSGQALPMHPMTGLLKYYLHQ